MITKASLIDDLVRMGISPTDTVLVHSSYKKIAGTQGVEGGGETVLDALIDYLTPEGLVVFPALSWKLGWLVSDDGGYIPSYEGPKAGYRPYGTDFHVRTTPTSDLGILPELFRARPGVVRSLCPTSSVCAMGKDAKAFCAGHEKAHSPLGFDSPWGKLYDRHAKTLFLGTTTCCNTYMHAIEDAAEVPNLFHPHLFHFTVEDYDGNVFSVSFRRHEPGHNHYYIKVQQELIDRGIITVTRFGEAECHLADNKAEADYMWKKLRQNPLLFTHEYNAAHP